MDSPAHFIDRHAVGRNRIPNADEPDLDVSADPLRRILRTELVANPLIGRFELQIVIAVPAIGAIGRACQAVELGLVIGLDETLAVDEAHHDPDREGPAAEAEAEQFVVGIAIVAAGKFVEGDDVAPQAETESAAEHGHWLE